MVALSSFDKFAVAYRVEELLHVASVELGMQFNSPRIGYRLRSTTAGTANYPNWSLEFNPIFLKDNKDEYIRHTVGHETAHLVAMQKWGISKYPHGREWQLVMKMFGLKPDVDHRYDVSKILVLNKWKCNCQVHEVSKRVDASLSAGGVYNCSLCNSMIIPCNVHG